MNKVPHCNECKYLDAYEIGKHTYYNCYNPNVYCTGKTIFAKDMKTSPQWCPLRKKDDNECSRKKIMKECLNKK